MTGCIVFLFGICDTIYRDISTFTSITIKIWRLPELRSMLPKFKILMRGNRQLCPFERMQLQARLQSNKYPLTLIDPRDAVMHNRPARCAQN